MSDVVPDDTDRERRPVVMLFDGWDFVPIDLKTAVRTPVPHSEADTDNSQDAGTPG